MFDPDRYGDDVVLNTAEVVEWTGWSARVIRALEGLRPIEKVPTRQHQYRSGDVKRAVLGDDRPRQTRTLQLRTAQ